MRFINHHDQAEWGRRTAAQIASALSCALRARGQAMMIAAGGSTPLGVYAELATADLDWSRITLVPSDERWVAETSARSNIAALKTRLRADGNTEAGRADFIPLYRSATTIEEAAALAASRVKASLPADICVLGMGADAHTASLFPHAPELRTALRDNAPLVIPARNPETGEQRVTLTLPALKSAWRILVLIRGTEKRAALDAALNSDDPDRFPILPFLADATIHYTE